MLFGDFEFLGLCKHRRLCYCFCRNVTAACTHNAIVTLCLAKFIMCSLLRLWVRSALSLNIFTEQNTGRDRQDRERDEGTRNDSISKWLNRRKHVLCTTMACENVYKWSVPFIENKRYCAYAHKFQHTPNEIPHSKQPVESLSSRSVLCLSVWLVFLIFIFSFFLFSFLYLYSAVGSTQYQQIIQMEKAPNIYSKS